MMKTSLLVLLIVAVYTVSTVPVVEDVGERKYERYVEVPGKNGEMHTVDLEAEPDLEILNEVARNPANNLYLLFTRRNQNSPQTLVMNNRNSITNSNFNSQHKTVVIAHGWIGDQFSDVNPAIRNAFLRKYEANVIVLDWSRLAGADYLTSVRGVPNVGRGLGQFLAFLNQVTGAPFNTMHLIGFSLGAHLVGNAGRELGGRVARITGLDPAGPMWKVNNNKLRASDGVYVEGIHTDGNTVTGLGYGASLGNADFFPNGGISQPGCDSAQCNHYRAWKFFAATVTHNHLIGRQCPNMQEMSRDNCHGQQLHMGNGNVSKSGSGIFRVNTGATYPF